MKKGAFTLSVIIIIIVIFLISCSNNLKSEIQGGYNPVTISQPPTNAPTSSPTITSTSTPTVNPTFSPIPTLTPTPNDSITEVRLK